MRRSAPVLGRLLVCAGSLGALSCTGSEPDPVSEAAADCPIGVGWSEGLVQYLDSTAALPVNDTDSLQTPDCAFHQWSWEAFVWATALLDGTPRFMTLPTPHQLFGDGSAAGATSGEMLTLGSRSSEFHGEQPRPEGAGAIVEADGNMLVAHNGYPVLASVHMNPSYFATAQRNLIRTGGYASQPADDYFDVGAAVFKATWLRLEPGETAPAGAFTTLARVPRLRVYRTSNTATVATVRGVFDTATVALVGLHVVGYTVNHPEFLWATFEHDRNAPALPDNTFSASSPGVDTTYTFYSAGTPFSEVNIPNQPDSAGSPPFLSFDAATGKFSPITQVVQENRTGGETFSPRGPQNIDALNVSAHTFLDGLSSMQPNPQSTFASYNLIGTVWMSPNTYLDTVPGWQNVDQANAVGSVDLSNSTAETFLQTASDSTSPSNFGNCFLCHNPQSFSADAPTGYPALTVRRIAISHVVAEGSPYSVPNVMPVKIPR